MCTRVIDAVIAGETDPQKLAALCTHRRLKASKEEIALAVAGCFTEHHKFMIRAIPTSISNIEAEIDHLDREIEQRMQPFEVQIQQLCEIPGMDVTSVNELLAEIGVDMEVFPTAAQLTSWAGPAPGNNESAGHKSDNDRMCVVCDTNQRNLLLGQIQEACSPQRKETRIGRDCRRNAQSGLPHAQGRHGLSGVG